MKGPAVSAGEPRWEVLWVHLPLPHPFDSRSAGLWQPPRRGPPSPPPASSPASFLHAVFSTGDPSRQAYLLYSSFPV